MLVLWRGFTQNRQQKLTLQLLIPLFQLLLLLVLLTIRAVAVATAAPAECLQLIRVCVSEWVCVVLSASVNVCLCLCVIYMDILITVFKNTVISEIDIAAANTNNCCIKAKTEKIWNFVYLFFLHFFLLLLLFIKFVKKIFLILIYKYTTLQFSNKIKVVRFKK